MNLLAYRDVRHFLYFAIFLFISLIPIEACMHRNRPHTILLPKGIEVEHSLWIFDHCEHEDDTLGGRTKCDCPHPVTSTDAKTKVVTVHCGR